MHSPQLKPHPFSPLSPPMTHTAPPLVRSPEEACGHARMECGRQLSAPLVFQKQAPAETWKPRDVLVIMTPCLNKR